jgi:tripartite-type tricarboxylate transporter receptor subunit TctC
MKLTTMIACCALLIAGSGPSLGQEGYPSKPIRLMVGFTPGTATDLVARQIAEGIKRNTGWVIYVDNKPGQGGSIAARELVRSEPDGYTLLVTANGPLITNPNLYSNVEYDALRDFVPIGQIATLPYIMVVNATKPYKSVQDVVAAAKKAPGTLNFSSTGVGTTSHLIGAMFSKSTGSDSHPLQGKPGFHDGSPGGQHRLHFRYFRCNHPSGQRRSVEGARRRFKAETAFVAGRSDADRGRNAREYGRVAGRNGAARFVG